MLLHVKAKLCSNDLVELCLSSWFVVSDSTICIFRSSSVSSCVLLSVPKHRGGGWTRRSCSPHLPADPLHPKHDSWDSGGLQVHPWSSVTTNMIIWETPCILMVLMCLLFRDVCHRDIVNLQVEMVRQFYIQLVRKSRTVLLLHQVWYLNLSLV